MSRFVYSNQRTHGNKTLPSPLTLLILWSEYRRDRPAPHSLWPRERQIARERTTAIIVSLGVIIMLAFIALYLYGLTLM